ncbi:MAG: hypothetical protein KF729_29715 [Sandaracinaceae bacterium]|nr:hypothetical protein [Sandaracinaceae bacterium]
MRRALWIVWALGAGGCSLLFDGGVYEGRPDAGASDAASDAAGEADAATRPCRPGEDACCSAFDCLTGSADLPFCAYHPADDVYRCAATCGDDRDCTGHPFGEVCVSVGPARTCGCTSEAHCNDPVFPYCGQPALPDCVECRTTSDCASGELCDLGLCEPCADGDGDGFLPEGCPSAMPPDCDDRDRDVYPGAPPRCGTGGYEDCDGRWRDLEGALGAGEAGIAWTGLTPTALGTVDHLGLAVLDRDQVLVAALVEGAPRIMRSRRTATALEMLPFDPQCEGAALMFASAVALFNDRGRPRVAVGGGRADATPVVATAELAMDGRWVHGRCEVIGTSVRRVAQGRDGLTVAIADTGTGQELVHFAGAAGVGRLAFDIEGPPWLGASADLIVVASQMGPLFRGVDLSDLVTHASLADPPAGRPAFVGEPMTGRWAYVAPRRTATAVLRGTCSSTTAMCMLDSSETPSGWVGVGGAVPPALDAALFDMTRFLVSSLEPTAGVGEGATVRLWTAQWSGTSPAPQRTTIVRAADVAATDLTAHALGSWRSAPTADPVIAFAFVTREAAGTRIGVRVLDVCATR